MKSKKMTQWLLLWMALLPTIAGHTQKTILQSRVVFTMKTSCHSK